jgi:hypothetical protein
VTPAEETDLLAQGWRPMPGVQGAWRRPPCHDGLMAQPRLGGETADQSCPTPQHTPLTCSKQFRIRLSHYHADRWQKLRAARQDAADLCFGAHTEGIDLAGLPGVASELRTTRLAITNLCQLAHSHGASLDLDRAHAALDRINSLLGDQP